jgi:UDP-N-acetylglucosamine enolpyruvyl transferase
MGFGGLNLDVIAAVALILAIVCAKKETITASPVRIGRGFVGVEKRKVTSIQLVRLAGG